MKGKMSFMNIEAFRRGVDVSNWQCNEEDGDVVTFKSALVRGLEMNYDDCDFDFVCCGVKDDIGCYVVTIYDYVW